MNPEDIGKILDEIGKRVGPAGEYTWKILVTQTRLEGLLAVGSGIAIIAVTIGLGFVFRKFALAEQAKVDAKYAENSYSHSNDWAFASSFVPIISMVFATPLAFALIVTSVLKVFNPEYYAIERLLNTLGSVLP